MKILINTSLDPHFIALEKEKHLITAHTWDNKRKDGREIWNFLQNHKKDLPNIKEINALSGPGGFTSLRVSSTIIKSLQIINPQLKIKSITGEEYCHFLAKKFPQKKFDYYLLNSFSDKIFLIKSPLDASALGGDLEGDNSIPIPLSEAQKILQNKTCWIETLPEQKQITLNTLISPLPMGEAGRGPLFTPQLLSQACQEKNPTDFFLPEYYFPAVQKSPYNNE